MRFEVPTLWWMDCIHFFKATWSGFIIEGMVCEPKMIALVTVLAYTIEEEGKILIR